jgi:hypothetical protein
MLTKALALVAESPGGDSDLDKSIYADIVDADLELATRLELVLNLADASVMVARIAVDSYVDAVNEDRDDELPAYSVADAIAEIENLIERRLEPG